MAMPVFRCGNKRAGRKNTGSSPLPIRDKAAVRAASRTCRAAAFLSRFSLPGQNEIRENIIRTIAGLTEEPRQVSDSNSGSAAIRECAPAGKGDRNEVESH